MITNVHCVSFSPCGGTEQVVKALARDVGLPCTEYNITLPKNRIQELHFSGEDLVFLGFPVYGGHMPLFFPDLISTLRGCDTPVILVAVYGNRAYEGAFLDMDAPIRANGFKPIAAIAAIAQHSSAPHIASGRPDADDKKKLAEFGRQALEKARAGGLAIQAPGAYPTWSLPPGMAIFPETDSNICTSCGLCAQVCPNNAIPADHPQHTIVAQCLVCAACIKYCPVKARALAGSNPEVRKELSSHLQHAVQRKEAELFL